MSRLNSSSLVPVFGQQNLAPLEPFRRLREGGAHKHYVCDALKERFEHYIEVDKSVRNEIISVGQLISLFIEGKQLLARDPFTGGWRTLQPRREDHTTKRSLNLMQFYATNWITKWMLSNPNVIVRAGMDSDAAIGAAKAADVWVDHYEAKFYSAWFNQQEALLCLTFGTYLERIRHDAGIQGIVGIREVIENREVQLGEGAGYCGDCGRIAPAAEFMQQAEGPDGNPMQANVCPQCGSEAVLVEPPASGTVPTVTGQEEVEMGDLVCETLPMPACWWDLKSRAEHSPWFIYRQRVPFGRIRQLLGNVKIPGGEKAESDFGLDVIDMLAKSGQALGGHSAHGMRRRNAAIWQDAVNLDEMWLGPECYADIEIKGDEETLAGVPLPGGQSLAEVFPNGLVAVGLNGMRLVLGLYAERHADHIVSGVYHMKALSGAGRGAADAIEPQRRINRFDSQGLNFMESTATPAVLYDASLIGEDEAGYLGHPKTNIPVDLSRLPDTRRLADAVMQMPPGSLPPQFVQYTQEFLNHMFQLSMHITDFSGGLPGVNNRTATGAQIATANSNSLFAPVLGIKSEVRVRAAEMTVEHGRRHFPLDRFFPLGGKHGAQRGIWLSGMRLEGELVFDYEKDSETPKNQFTKREDAMAFFALFGGFIGYLQALQQDPQMVTELARLWNVRIESRDYDVVSQRCQARVEQMMQGLRMGVQDPAGLIQMINPPMSAFEPAHLEKARWWSEWLDTDDALDLQNFPLRLAAELMAQMHFEFGGQVAQVVAEQAGTLSPEQGKQGWKS